MAGSGDSDNGNTIVKVNATAPIITKWGPQWALIFFIVISVVTMIGWVVYRTGNVIDNQTETNRMLTENLQKQTLLQEAANKAIEATAVDQKRSAETMEEMLKVLKETGELGNNRHNELIGNQKHIISQHERMERLLEDIRENMKQ